MAVVKCDRSPCAQCCKLQAFTWFAWRKRFLWQCDHCFPQDGLWTSTCRAEMFILVFVHPRSRSQWCPSLTSRRPKPPSWCQMLWWSPLQTIGWARRLLVSSHYDFIAHTWTLNCGNVGCFLRILPFSHLNYWTRSALLQTQKPRNRKTVLSLQYVFVSFLSRDNTYKVLMSVCLHLEVGQTSHM